MGKLRKQFQLNVHWEHGSFFLKTILRENQRKWYYFVRGRKYLCKGMNVEVAFAHPCRRRLSSTALSCSAQDQASSSSTTRAAGISPSRYLEVADAFIKVAGTYHSHSHAELIPIVH